MADKAYKQKEDETEINYNLIRSFDDKHKDFEFTGDGFSYDKTHVILSTYSGYSFLKKYKCAYLTYNKFGTSIRVEFTDLWETFNEVPEELQKDYSRRLHPFEQTVIDILCRREWYFIILRYIIAVCIVGFTVNIFRKNSATAAKIKK